MLKNNISLLANKHNRLKIFRQWWKNMALLISLGFLSTLLFASVFKNIAYPLLWNDEADTTMFSTRILKYGYPKVHDGKNVLNLTAHTNQGLGIKEKYDAFITTPWVPYYFSVVGAFFAGHASDFYAKTAMLRIPFAVIGMLGLALFAPAVLPFFGNFRQKALFLILFVFFELLSVSLTLHLREVRYYSLVIFLSAAIFCLVIRYEVRRKLNYFIFFASLVILLLLLLNTFYPAFFIFILSLAIYVMARFLMALWRQVEQGSSVLQEVSKYPLRDYTRRCLKSLAPLVTAALLAVPFVIFFEVFSIQREMAAPYQDIPGLYWSNLGRVFGFFHYYEFLYLALAAVVAVLGLWIHAGTAMFVKEAKNAGIWQILKVAALLVVFFLIHALVIAKTFYVFERYFIVLQPVLTIITLFLGYAVFVLAPRLIRIYSQSRVRLFFWCAAAAIFIFNGINHEAPLRGHVYELFHQYKGPLDYVISYLAQKYEHPENLIIATNYEEHAYMYYLGSKVIIGYVGNNLEEDMQAQPDIIIIRKYRDNFIKELNELRERGTYEKVSFPIFDAQVNNIPELYCPIFHQYKTQLAKNESEQLDIFVKKE